MVLRWLRLPPLARRETWIAAGGALAGMVILAGSLDKLGTLGLVVPLALILGVVLISRPVLTLVLVTGLTIFCEGSAFGLLNFTSDLYIQVYHDISLLDLMVALLVVSSFLDILRNRRPVILPRALALPLALLGLAMAVGAIVGHASGVSLRYSIFGEHVLAYMLLVPIAVVNLEVDNDQLMKLLGGALALAVLKAVLGLIEVSEHLGTRIEGLATLTYYEPTSNWLIMIALLSLLVAVIIRARPPRWALLGSPLMIACLLLSYRRSFWIAAVLGVLLVLILATSHGGRRALIPAALAVGAAIWLLGSIHFQSNLPIVKRITSLSSSKLEANAEDRYRLDERANVLSEIKSHPITGLGMAVAWQATAAPLSVEHEEGRQYVHFDALWFWLKLGILGLCAYIGLIAGTLVVAWQAWRASHEPMLRAFALASVCGTAGLVTMDTTASFTGVEPRFTLVFAVQLGLLALLVRGAPSTPGVDLEPAL